MDVPTIVSFSSSCGNVEQNADIPVPPGRVGVRGFQGFRPGQDSAAIGRADHAEIPVPRRGFGGGIHSLHPGQSSTAFGEADHRVPAATAEQHVDIPVLRGAPHDSHQNSFLQLVLLICLIRQIKGFSHFFAVGKKCEDPARPGVGTGRGL